MTYELQISHLKEICAALTSKLHAQCSVLSSIEIAAMLTEKALAEERIKELILLDSQGKEFT